MPGSRSRSAESDEDSSDKKTGEVIAENRRIDRTPVESSPATDFELNRDASDDQLAGLIESEVIPRLMLSHRVRADGLLQEEETPPPGPAPTIVKLGKIVVNRDLEEAVEFVQGLVDDGLSIDRVFLDVLSETARHLGRGWENDEIDFVAVTIGLSRLQQIVHRLSPGGIAKSCGTGSGFRALLLPTPGEQHTFGLLLIEDALRRAGWEVWGGHAITKADLDKMISRHNFHIIGFTVSHEPMLDPLKRTIQDVRRQLGGHGCSIVVGGRIFNEGPDLHLSVGADGMARDAREAVGVCGRLANLAQASRT